MRRRAALALLALLGGCATRPPAPPADGPVPQFALQPYEPFSRAAAIALAEGEWRAFGSLVQDAPAPAHPRPEDKPERQEGLWQRVGLYWWIGVGEPERRWTGKHDARGQVFPAEDDGDFAWSAAFISFVMRLAGAGDRFPYAASHSTYINAAAEASEGRRPDLAIRARDPAAYAPVPGDLVCFGRLGAKGLRFADLPAGPFTSHCALVVRTGPEEDAVIGGNVADAVSLTHVPVTAQGRLAGPDGAALDRRYDWFAVIEVRYAR